MLIFSTTAKCVAGLWIPPNLSRKFNPLCWTWPPTVKQNKIPAPHTAGGVIPLTYLRTRLAFLFSSCNSPTLVVYIGFVTQYFSLVCFCDSPFYFCTWFFFQMQGFPHLFIILIWTTCPKPLGWLSAGRSLRQTKRCMLGRDRAAWKYDAGNRKSRVWWKEIRKGKRKPIEEMKNISWERKEEREGNEYKKKVQRMTLKIM